jgi:hypothetical protein
MLRAFSRPTGGHRADSRRARTPVSTCGVDRHARHPAGKVDGQDSLRLREQRQQRADELGFATEMERLLDTI